ncbi:MAG: hypothetical protein NTV00_09100 [Methylococcales bacterium]|nr:hypothetical protein [Methylococcales bacterium]
MRNHPPVQSLKSLLVASAVATLLASIILVTAVLPAEYGIDPTGVGKKLGLTTLSGSAEDIIDPTIMSCKEQLAQWTDVTTIIVPAHSGLEYKFLLAKDATFDYAWTTDGAKLYFDFHGEPTGDKTGYFKSFTVNTDNQSTGVLTASFAGAHGWYWENKTPSPITVLLNTKGVYHVLGLM